MIPTRRLGLLLGTALAMASFVGSPVARAQAPSVRSEVPGGEAEVSPDGDGSSERSTTLELSLHAQYGGTPNEAAANRYGVGLSLRAGVELPTPIYVGLSVERFFGIAGGYTLDSLPGISVENHPTLDQALVWVGYGFAFDGVTVRPLLGVGAGRTSVETTSRVTVPNGDTTADSTSHVDLACSPAVELSFPVGAVAMLVNARYNTLLGGDPDDNDSALVIGVGLSLPLPL